MTISEINSLHKKAESRKDGVYSFKNNVWVVKNGCFVAYSDPYGECFKRCGSFNLYIGKVDRYDRVKNMNELLKKL